MKRTICWAKPYICLLALLLTTFKSFSQEPSDSAYWNAELEDSVSGLSIKPIKHPRKLVQSIIKKLLYDSEHRSKAILKYQVEETYNMNTPNPWTVKCVIPGESGVGIWANGEVEDFHYNRLTPLTWQDSSYIKFSLVAGAGNNAILKHVEILSNSEMMSKRMIFNKLRRVYKITAYSISDESGRGVYRISFAPKRKPITDFGKKLLREKFTGTAYFDSHTLCLTQFKAEKERDLSGYGNIFILEPSTSKRSKSASAQSSEPLVRYKIDYDESAGKPVVKHIRKDIVINNKLTSRTIIQRLH